jgi:RND family efflux transporter MFP subunit
MIASVNESDLSHLRIGQPVRVSVRAYPDRRFSGRILRLGEELDPQTRTLQVRVHVPNERNLLKPQMFATAEIERATVRNMVVVPDSAIQDVGGHKVVFVRTAPDRFVLRPVQTGAAASGKTEVVAGLRAGETVAVRGSFILKSQLLRSSLEEDE